MFAGKLWAGLRIASTKPRTALASACASLAIFVFAVRGLAHPAKRPVNVIKATAINFLIPGKIHYRKACSIPAFPKTAMQYPGFSSRQKLTFGLSESFETDGFKLAPFFETPPPASAASDPFLQLWHYFCRMQMWMAAGATSCHSTADEKYTICKTVRTISARSGRIRRP